MMFEHLHEVHQWLAEQSNDKRFYMKILKLNWRHSPSTEEHYLSVLTKLADELKQYPFIVRDLLIHGDWRNNLIGNAVALLQQNAESEAYLSKRLLMSYSWVAPQLAAGFALLTNGNSVSQLEKYLEHFEADELLKTPLSIYTALKFLGNEKAADFESKPIFNTLQANDRDGCVRIAEIHYKYWQSVLAK
jgi:hypothetical protein